MRLFVFWVLIGFLMPAVALGKTPASSGCDYEKYQVEIEITSVKEVASSKSDKYEVRFVVVLTDELPAQIENRVYGRDYQMLLQNKKFPGPLFLKKYDITTGKLFDCYFNIRTRGNCRSSFFEFPDIKLDDYFESQL